MKAGMTIHSAEAAIRFLEHTLFLRSSLYSLGFSGNANKVRSLKHLENAVYFLLCNYIEVSKYAYL